MKKKKELPTDTVLTVLQQRVLKILQLTTQVAELRVSKS